LSLLVVYDHLGNSLECEEERGATNTINITVTYRDGIVNNYNEPIRFSNQLHNFVEDSPPPTPRISEDNLETNCYQHYTVFSNESNSILLENYPIANAIEAGRNLETVSKNLKSVL